jgi:hypothetical protein
MGLGTDGEKVEQNHGDNRANSYQPNRY